MFAHVSDLMIPSLRDPTRMAASETFSNARHLVPGRIGLPFASNSTWAGGETEETGGRRSLTIFYGVTQVFEYGKAFSELVW